MDFFAGSCVRLNIKLFVKKYGLQTSFYSNCIAFLIKVVEINVKIYGVSNEQCHVFYAYKSLYLHKSYLINSGTHSNIPLSFSALKMKDKAKIMEFRREHKNFFLCKYGVVNTCGQ